ncbi:hypothetical protein [Amycolatopsis sp. NPDC098790]|uniref:hypothetical protein n=1 Tax=Amycolatopsis sp. NPDC098790 TaxID=3363939 RepID=UPI00380C8B79
MNPAMQSPDDKTYVAALRALIGPGLYAADLENSPLIDLPVVHRLAGRDSTPNAKARSFIELFEGVVTGQLVKNDRTAAEMLFALDNWAGVPARDRRVEVARLRDPNWTWESSYRKEPLERDLTMIFRALVRWGVEARPARGGTDPGQTRNAGEALPEHANFTPVSYTTKFAMPDVPRFWNDLCLTAKRRFYLVGGTNKSWFGKSSEQSHELGQAMTRILLGGGTVKIVSRRDSVVVAQTKHFFDRFVFDPARRDGQQAALQAAIDAQRLVYVTVPHSNYDAVISDDRIVLLPIPNTPSFRNEALVLEWKLDGGYHPFMNYLADIDRTISQADPVGFDAQVANR